MWTELVTRVRVFGPEILIITCAALTVRVYIAFAIRRFGEKNLTDIDWVQTNGLKLYLRIGLPVILLWAPTAEEILFRMPVLILFTGLSHDSWQAILVSAGLFALPHLFGYKFGITSLVEAKQEGLVPSGTVTDGAAAVERKHPHYNILIRLVHLSTSFCLGALCGWAAIRFQSLWAAVGVHAVWNLTMPIILPMVAVGVVLISRLIWEHFSS